MNRKIFGLAVTLLMTSVAFASGILMPDLKANIPFDFHVGGKNLPAGEYKILQTSTPGVLKLSAIDFTANAVVITQTETGTKAAKANRLDFRKYGNQYFLGAVLVEGAKTSRYIPVSSEERKTADRARFLAGHEVAPEIISIACQ